MASTSNDKAPALSEKSTPPQPLSEPKRRFFGREPKARAVDGKGVGLGGGSAAIAVVDDVTQQQAEADATPDVPKPVALLALFRYSSRSERILMIAGLVASGASERRPPPMSRTSTTNAPAFPILASFAFS